MATRCSSSLAASWQLPALPLLGLALRLLLGSQRPDRPEPSPLLPCQSQCHHYFGQLVGSQEGLQVGADCGAQS